ncbi:putative gegh 16 protein [Mycena venus]|uniref:Putative gegh 16 protein n=1 Tax=Mycena venus TaxID=2733690 RepID=A0A8H6YL30_9AGAR|nr:putative gegh 16 protein [Mycena venus]
MRTSSAILLTSVASAYGHVVITSVIGANGVTTTGFGVTNNTLRTGTTEQPFQLDTSVLKNLKDDPCGATLEGGSINIATALADAVSQGGGILPSLSANGTVSMMLHQVNADGGGPFTAMVNTDATGATWVPATVLIQAPGTNGILHGGPANVPFSAQIPPGTTCTGGTDKATCLIRINNGGTNNTLSLAQGAGPFGGCVAVTQGSTFPRLFRASAKRSTANAAVAVSSGAAAGTTATGTTTGKTKVGKAAAKAANGAKVKRPRFPSRHFFPTLESRDEAVENFRRARVLADITYLAARGELTADLIDEIKTATGTAIDIPIDNLAGQDDSADLGGNSTTAAGAVLTLQQAVNLKKAVQDAIATALTILSSGGTVVAQNAQNINDTNAANAAADAAFQDGSLTSINLGNAGVGFFETAVVDSLLGPLATITQVEAAAATVTGAAATLVTDTAVAASVTDTAAAAATNTIAATTGKTTKTGKKAAKNRQN